MFSAFYFGNICALAAWQLFQANDDADDDNDNEYDDEVIKPPDNSPRPIIDGIAGIFGGGATTAAPAAATDEEKWVDLGVVIVVAEVVIAEVV